MLLIVPYLLLTGCQPPEQSARDAIATSKGMIVYGQQHYGVSCKANPTQPVCADINKAIAANNTAIDALETYCQLTSASAPTDVCKPVKALLPALQVTLANLNQTTTDLKGAIGK